MCIMSTSRQNKKVKPINLENQPIISQFIVDSAISRTSPESTKNQETKNKKRRRSTGNNNPVNKRHNSVPDPLTSTEENLNKMTDTPVEMSSTTNTMLNEIKIRKPYGFMQSSFWVIMMVHVMVCGDL